MNLKMFAGIGLMISGAIIAFNGAMKASETTINLGICGIFIGAVLFSFSRQRSFANLFKPYHETLKDLAGYLEIKRAIYIPRCKYLPEGGVFLAINEDFELDLARLSYETPIVGGREKEAGILFRNPGIEIINEAEESSFEAISSALRARNLIKSANLYEEEILRIFIDGVAVDFCSGDCRFVACPICSSLLMAIAEESEELLMVEEFKVGERIEILARKIGGVEKWT
ncbi:MAG: hypothetical protein QXY19_02830 [Archaeoglobaceae archaeon]